MSSPTIVWFIWANPWPLRSAAKVNRVGILFMVSSSEPAAFEWQSSNHNQYISITPDQLARPATKAGCPICPDFLRRLVALIHFMRLSLMKGAHADLSSTARQEIGVKPGFGLSGIPQHSTSLFLSLGLPRRAVGAQPRDMRERPPCVRVARSRAGKPPRLPEAWVVHAGCAMLLMIPSDVMTDGTETKQPFGCFVSCVQSPQTCT